MVVFDTLTRSLFDVSLSADAIKGFDCDEFLRCQDLAMQEAIRQAVDPLRRYLSTDPRMKAGFDARDKLIDFGRIILEAFRSKQKKADQELSIMDHIVRNDYPTEKHRISDVVVFMIAGHETTAHTLSFFLYCLAKNPVERRKLQVELDALVPSAMPSSQMPNGKRVLTLSDISNADYLTYCLKESQRFVNCILL
jgi:cytochrome P450